MIKILLLAAAVAFSTPPEKGWLTDFDKASKEASQSGKLLLLNFSGSDWCVPCKKMQAHVFQSEAFSQYAADKLVLLNADFPRSKKHKLSDRQVKQNERLAEKYDPNGLFPMTLLLDAEGHVLKKWEGLPKGSAEDFVEDIKRAAKQ